MHWTCNVSYSSWVSVFSGFAGVFTGFVGVFTGLISMFTELFSVLTRFISEYPEFVSVLISFTGAFTRTCHWMLSSARWMKSTVSHVIKIHRVYFLQDKGQIFCMDFSSPTSRHPWLDELNNNCWRVQITKFIVTQVSSYSPPSLSLWSHYALHYTLLSLNQNKQDNYSTLYCQPVSTLRLCGARLVDTEAESVTAV